MIKKLLAWFRGPVPTPEPPPAPPKAKRISAMALARASAKSEEASPPQVEAYRPPPGVVPAAHVLAMDSITDYAYVNQYPWTNGTFKGFQYLAQLAQQPEYRKITAVRADEMCRKWVKLTSKGDTDVSDKIEKLTQGMKDFKLRDVFRQMAEYDGFYGRGQIFIDLGDADNAPEIATPLTLVPAKIPKGKLVAFRAVEPTWTYPGVYQSTNPLGAGFYAPDTWYVMGKTVHRTRLLTFVSRVVPDILKPSYNFSGLSMSQMAEPYVNNWLRTRDSVGDMIHSYSTSGIRTDMGSVLSEGDDGAGLYARMDLYNKMRDNKGLMVMDKDAEEFFQFNTPLSGLDALQAQAQEQQSAVASIPLVKLLGITPSGLNASSDGEIKVFYDDINAQQNAFFGQHLKTCLEVLQLNLFGDIDDNIGFEFLPLWENSPTEAATIRKTDAETDAILVGAQAIDAEEVRERLMSDDSSPYHSLTGAAPVPTVDPLEPDDPSTDD